MGVMVFLPARTGILFTLQLSRFLALQTMMAAVDAWSSDPSSAKIPPPSCRRLPDLAAWGRMARNPPASCRSGVNQASSLCRTAMPGAAACLLLRAGRVDSQSGDYAAGCGPGALAVSMMPPPRQTSPSYNTADCPGVTAHWAAGNASAKRSVWVSDSVHGTSACR